MKEGDKVKIPTYKNGLLISLTASDLSQVKKGEAYSIHVYRARQFGDKYMIIKRFLPDGQIALVQKSDKRNNGDFFSPLDLELYDPFQEQIENELGVNNL